MRRLLTLISTRFGTNSQSLFCLFSCERAKVNSVCLTVPGFLFFFLHFRLASLQTIRYQPHSPRMLMVFVAASLTLLMRAFSTEFNYFQDDTIISCKPVIIHFKGLIIVHFHPQTFWEISGNYAFLICTIGCSFLEFRGGRRREGERKNVSVTLFVHIKFNESISCFTCFMVGLPC